MKETIIHTNYSYNWKVNSKTFEVYKDDISFIVDIKKAKYYFGLFYNRKKIGIEVEFNNNVIIKLYSKSSLNLKDQQYLLNYVIETFDLNYDLKSFYKQVKNNSILKRLIKDNDDSRAYSFLNLYEAFLWTIIGQQINMKFAYSIKQQLVKKYGKKLKIANKTIYIFPEPKKLKKVSYKNFKNLKLTNNKIKTIKLITDMFLNKQISYQILEKLENSYDKKQFLLKIKGIGIWSASYLLIRSLKINDIFLFKDIGINNCLKSILGINNIDDQLLINLENKYKNYCRYAIWYIWKELY